jgi:hypothetical protein
MWRSRRGQSIVERGIVAATALLLGFHVTPAPATVGPGALAPDFTLNDLAGVPHTLSSLRGQVVLLAFVGYG